MAEAIGKGITDAGKEAEVVYVSDASIEELKKAKAFALGCPAMGAEVLEELEMEPFVCDVEGFVAGKTIALFGSYGWGDGQWMRDWSERMSQAGATVLNGEKELAEVNLKLNLKGVSIEPVLWKENSVLIYTYRRSHLEKELK